MKAMLGLTALALVAGATPSFGYQLTCLRDYRPVDGDMVRVELTIQEGSHRATSKITAASDSPAASHREETTVRALDCIPDASEPRAVSCTGPIGFRSEVVVGAQGKKVVRVTDGYHRRTYEFADAAIGSGAIKNGCEVKYKDLSPLDN